MKKHNSPFGILAIILSFLTLIHFTSKSRTAHGHDEPVPARLSNPSWGIGVAFSPRALGGHSFAAASGNSTRSSVTLSAEYMPTVIQKYGILGIGPSFSVFPPNEGMNITKLFSVHAAGAHARYQARYFSNQFLVPAIGYSVEYLHYQIDTGPAGGFFVHGPLLGLWLNLNILEPSAAYDAYSGSRILRQYLVFEAKSMSGGDSRLSIGEPSYYFGLRFEH